MAASDFQREVKWTREVLVRHGDTIQGIAERELGDAGRWPEIVALNNLKPPYFASVATDGAIVYGSSLLVQSPVPSESNQIVPGEVFGIDIQLSKNGLLMDASGDLLNISGTKNLLQAIKNAIATDLGELIFHPDYGCALRTLIGEDANGPNTLLARNFARRTVENDPRIDSTETANLEVAGDTIRVDMNAITISGKGISVSATVNQ